MDPCMYSVGCCDGMACAWNNGRFGNSSTTLACLPFPEQMCQTDEDGPCLYDKDCCGSMTCQMIGQGPTKRLACEQS